MNKAEAIKKRQWNYLYKYLQDNKMSYKAYLLTDHWKDVRKRYWKSKLHNHTCYACGSKQNLQVHHKTYKRIGQEYLRDLCLLCGDCHRQAHQIEKTRDKGILYGAAKRLRKDIQHARLSQGAHHIVQP